ncbi:MAG: SoxR reducing system RseC family protein [Spirochaetaceae bacterium]|jgi:positive regulator of sigma E activity|nr:SoxR reducing system RseC family protein [Spirochaetaceae bacterium]
MTEIGRVREISGSRVTLKRGPLDACFGCMKGECRAGGVFVAENPNRLPLAPGQLVETELPPGAALREGFFTIIPPIASCIAAFLLSGLVFPGLGDPPRAVIGLFVLFGTAVAFYLFRRRFPSKTIPRIVGIKDIVSFPD